VEKPFRIAAGFCKHPSRGRKTVICAILYTYEHGRVSVRLARSTKTRLQQLAKSTGRSRAFLAVEAIEEYLDINGWQVARHSQCYRFP
jgi:hypothetical protein